MNTFRIHVMYMYVGQKLHASVYSQLLVELYVVCDSRLVGKSYMYHNMPDM